MLAKIGRISRLRVVGRFVRALAFPFITLIAFHAVIAWVYVYLDRKDGVVVEIHDDEIRNGVERRGDGH